MTEVFVDESIHDRAEFILAAMIFADEGIQNEIEKILRAARFVPGKDEYKSSAKMEGNEQAQEVRSKLTDLMLRHCKIGIVVCSSGERKQLAKYCCSMLSQIVQAEQTIFPGTVFFDEGMNGRGIELPKGWNAEWNCDSKKVFGIQIADCAANIASVLLLSELGINKKQFIVDEYDPEQLLPLGWLLWTSLRYSLAGGPIDGDQGNPERQPFGLWVSESCSDVVRQAVEQRFRSVWLGCTA